MVAPAWFFGLGRKHTTLPGEIKGGFTADGRRAPVYRNLGVLRGQKESPRLGTGAKPENIMKVKGIGPHPHDSRPE